MRERTLYRFDDVILDPVRRYVERNGQRIPLPETAFAVLLALIEGAPEPVGKRILIDAAWPDCAVGEDSLVQAIGVIRSALGDDAKSPKFVKTVHRHGYCFVAPIRREISPTSRLFARNERPRAEPRSERSRLPAILGAMAAVVFIGLMLWMWGGSESVAPAAARPVDERAREAWLKGHHVCGRHTEEALLQASRYFDEAIAIDGKFAAPYAGRASCLNLMATYGFVPSADARPRAMLAAGRALDLDPSLAEAHAAVALVKGFYLWEFDEADAAFKTSLRLDPSDVVTRAWYASFLMSQLRFDEALDELGRARRLDPVSDIVNVYVARALLLNGQAEAAEAELRTALELNPSFPLAEYSLGIVLLRTGRLDESIAAFERCCVLTGETDFAVAGLAHVCAVAGNTERAVKLRQGLWNQSADRFVSPVSLAVAALGLGRLDEAFDALEDAYLDRQGWLVYLRSEPLMDPARSDPRYEDLLLRIGLAPPQN